TTPTFFREFLWKEIRYAAIRYKTFPLFQSFSQLLLALGAQLPILLIGVFYGTEIVGVFGLAQNMINLPMDLIGTSVSQVYYSKISEYGKHEPEKIYRLTMSIAKKLVLIGVIPVGIIVLFGPWLFSKIF